MRRTLVATLSAALLSALVISLIRGTLAVAGYLALAVAALLIVAGVRARKTRHPRYSLARLADPAPTPEEKAAGRG
jgi:hypothetical protein